MTTTQIQLIKGNWELIKPLGDRAGELFYKNLFAAAPQLRHLFAENMKAQQNKLIQMLGFIVAHLHQLHTISDAVRSLGRKHHHYQAQPHHYDTIGLTLLTTLEQASGSHWNAELADAWQTAFNTLKNMMIIAQEQERSACEEQQAVG